MLKKLMIATAASALLAGSALSQSPTPPSNPAAEKAQVVDQQTSDQMLMSKFKGTNVIGSNDEKIGDVNDILFDKDGKILAYVVGVGGFLGIGAKDVAMAPSSFQVQPATDKDNMKLKLAMTKDELKNAAEFKPYKEPSRTSTVGQGSPSTGMTPRGGAPSPGGK
jgi:sporulation protein YlmC with PRC-barrel domain